VSVIGKERVHMPGDHQHQDTIARLEEEVTSLRRRIANAHSDEARGVYEALLKLSLRDLERAKGAAERRAA